ncbi:MAG: hypothetical protein K2X29_03160 [Candidatus Obscuribacterales bacterium]|nr:hypothetical protein [Candidatus Obscuribacterales bacterium]
MSQAVMCLVSTTAEAECLMSSLRAAGFSNNDISMVLPDVSGPRDLTLEKHSKAPEGTAIGASTGALLGAVFGWFTGTGMVTIPTLGSLIAAGPIIAALSVAAVGTAIGGVIGGLIGLGIPEFEAKQYEGKVKSGNILISVHSGTAEQTKRAEEIFKGAHGREVNAVAEEHVAETKKAA